MAAQEFQPSGPFDKAQGRPEQRRMGGSATPADSSSPADLSAVASAKAEAAELRRAGTGAAQETHLPVLALVESLGKLCESGAPAEMLRRELLRGLVALSDGPYAAFWRVDSSKGALTLADEVMPRVSERAARNWTAPLQELAAGVIQQGIIRYRTLTPPDDAPATGPAYVALALPVRGEPAIAGCVTLVAMAGAPILSDAGVALLRLMADTGMAYSLRRVAAHYEGSYKSLSGGWELIGEMLAFSGPLEMAQVLVNRIRLSFGADRASLGFVRREKVTVVAISNEDIIDKRSNIVRLMQAAQSEALVAGEPRVYRERALAEPPAAGATKAGAEAQEPAADSTRLTAALSNVEGAEFEACPQNQSLARASGAKVVCSVPLREKKEIIAVLTFEFTNAPFTEGTRRLMDVVAGQLGPILGLAIQNDRGIFKRSGDGLSEAARWAFGKKRPWLWAGIAAGAALVAAAALVKCDFNVSGNCVLQPALRQIYAAPFDSTIREASVRPGDTVAEGQTLVSFDEEYIKMQLRKAQSDLAAVQEEMNTYMAGQEVAKFVEAEARRKSLEAQVELLDYDLARAVLKAGFPGIVISGADLHQHIGRSVRMGEPLVEVAPLNDLLLEVEVDQGDVDYVKAGQTGSFTTKARPSFRTPFKVNLVRPAPEVRDRASVYIAEATVSNPDEAGMPGWLRPGMEGAAKIEIDRRNVTWVALRKLVNWVRLKLWW